MQPVIKGILFLILAPLTLLILYQWLLAICSLFFRIQKLIPSIRHAEFLIIIPAHNEEAGLASTLDSLRNLDYPNGQYRTLIIADRCTDGTALVARSQGAECFERSDGTPGKGAALAWGIQQAIATKISFDAVVIIDADTLVDQKLLSAFNVQIHAGHRIQQGYNYISNPWASPFTRIIAVTGVLRNGRYYAGKTVLGLQGMLTGTGMCISKEVLERYGWTAFSVGEDWEFSVDLLLAGEEIYFNPLARTYAKESQSLKQASHQRLRWASGRYAVMGGKACALIKQGLRTRSFSMVDAAVTLVSPNYSSQASLVIICLIGSLIFDSDPGSLFLSYWAAGLLVALAGYFFLGVFSTREPLKALAGLLLLPVFLPWRLTIELLGMLGFGRRHWGKMSRATTPSQPTNR